MSCSSNDLLKSIKAITGGSTPHTTQLSMVSLAMQLHDYAALPANSPQQGQMMETIIMFMQDPEFQSCMETLASENEEIKAGLDKFKADVAQAAESGTVPAVEDAPAEPQEPKSDPFAAYFANKDMDEALGAAEGTQKALDDEDEPQKPAPKAGKGGKKPAKPPVDESDEEAALNQQYLDNKEHYDEIGAAALNETMTAMNKHFAQTYPLYEADLEASELSGAIARSVSNHLKQDGDGVIKPKYNEMFQRLTEIMDEVDKNTSYDPALKSKFLEHYEGIVNDLGACMASASGPKEGWQRPKRATSFIRKEVEQTGQPMKILPPPPPAPPMPTGDAVEDVIRQNTTMQGMQLSMNRFASMIFPAAQIDETLAAPAREAARSLSKHREEGVVTENGSKMLALLKQNYAILKSNMPKYRKFFDNDAQREGFMAHYEAIITDLDACATAIQQNTPKKPEYVKSYLETKYVEIQNY